jgi:hypothetical protein
MSSSDLFSQIECFRWGVVNLRRLVLVNTLVYGLKSMLEDFNQDKFWPSVQLACDIDFGSD